METEDIIYAAAFLDGEGCFTMGHNCKPVVACENTYAPIIKWLHYLFGGSLTTTHPRNPKHRPTLRWAVVCHDAEEVCLTVLPYLKEKAQQAIGLVVLSYTFRIPKNGKGVSFSVLDERNRIKTKMKELKCRIQNVPPDGGTNGSLV